VSVTRLQLLEGFGLENAGARIELPVGMQRILAFLAPRGPAHRCVVAGTLWPEVPESRALACLRTGVWRINRIARGPILTQGMRLATPTTMSVDSREQEFFATRVLREHDDDEHWIAEGIDNLWPGELLPGWYDDWVVLERQRLSPLRLHALEHSAMVLTRRGQLDTALQLALEAVRAEPLRETANAVLMSVYLAEGSLSDAIHQYDVFSDLLQRELGLEPSRSLHRLVPRPRQGRPGAPGLLHPGDDDAGRSMVR
jgi:DNA-binding SARP family transcriptional activator